MEESTLLSEEQVSPPVLCEEESLAEPKEEAIPPQEETPPSPAPTDYAALASEDLSRLRKEFPELSSLGDLTELEDPVRYGALRELGLTPREAYLATTTPRPLPRYDNRSHLRSAIPRTVTAREDGMSEGELLQARDLFTGLSDSELHRLYQKVNQ